MSDQRLHSAIARVPPGRWAVAVSGGADSTALLHLLLWQRPDLHLFIAHLDHETRAGESAQDAAFVQQMAAALGLPIYLQRRSEVEPRIAPGVLPANLQARYRRLRLELFREVIAREQLAGVIQAHHADDQAETIFMRLIRGAGIEGLCGMPQESVVEGVRILHPLLSIHRAELRAYLQDNGLTWREDASNRSLSYQRNRVRQFLSQRPEFNRLLLAAGEDFTRLSEVLDAQAPVLGARFRLAALRDLPEIVQDHALRRWLLMQGVPADAISLDLLQRLRAMGQDSASPPALVAPGNLHIRRRAGEVFVAPPAVAER